LRTPGTHDLTVAPAKDPEAEALLRSPLDQADLARALDQLYETFAPSVERWVRRLAGPNADVEDLMHDVFVVAVRRRSEFRGDGKLSTWLFRIAEHIVRKRRSRDRMRALLRLRYQTSMEPVQAPCPTPLEDLERQQRNARLYAALDRLPDKLRTVSVLYDIEGLSANEVAQLLGIHANAVWVRVHRARALLHKQLVGKKDEREGTR
jgi:RNA polymerase sigma-70 factor (ECF subfamily)